MAIVIALGSRLLKEWTILTGSRNGLKFRVFNLRRTINMRRACLVLFLQVHEVSMRLRRLHRLVKLGEFGVNLEQPLFDLSLPLIPNILVPELSDGQLKVRRLAKKLRLILLSIIF